MHGYTPHMWTAQRAFQVTLIAAIALLCGGSGCVTDGDNPPAPQARSGVAAVGEIDAGSMRAAAPSSGASVAPDPMDDDAGDVDEDADVPPQTCANDDECQDQSYCNGTEVCFAGLCQPGALPPCTDDHPCMEELADCDCANPDLDDDDHDAKACNGDDCDESNLFIHEGAVEICDSAGVDEDCDETTYNRRSPAGAHLDGDNDGDGRVSRECFNVDRKTGKALSRGDDCRDNNPRIKPGASEVCDYEDNDCNDVVDEAPAPDGSQSGIAGSLREAFYADDDHDGFGDTHGEPQMECGHYQLLGHVRGTEPRDCNDDRPNIHPHALEICDGFDNDCDALVDAADDGADGSPFIRPFAFTDTVLSCELTSSMPPAIDWVIKRCPANKLWCANVVDNGCTTDATALSTCGACETDCKFACGGAAGCDDVEQLSLGEVHSCARTRLGQVACWGRGADGRLGTDLLRREAVASKVIGIEEAVYVAAGREGSCAIIGPNRELYCWGSNRHQQLASDAEDASSVPLPVFSPDGDPVLAGVRDVAVSIRHTCAVLLDGKLLCWGRNANGLLAGGTPGNGLTALPHPALDENYEDVTNAASVALGEAHGCALTSPRRVLCWGANDLGQLGNRNAGVETEVALEVPGLSDVSKLTVGGLHTCALSDGTVLCWGANTERQLGRDSGADDDIPVAVEGLPEIADVAGRVHCWGANGRGQSGDPQLGRSAPPTIVDLPAPATALAVGGLHACAQVDDGRVFCWGHNAYGQLGTGRSSQQPQPLAQPIMPLSR